MKIVITGAGGFIGSEVIRALLEEEDTQAVCLSRQAKEDADTDRVVWRQTDYSAQSLVEVMEGADAVIHLAAVRGTTGTMADYQINELLTENILLAMGECGIRRMVFASSIAVYSDLAMMPWTEDMRLSPKTLYGITKAACEHLCFYYAKKYGFTCAAIRIAQVLGPGEKRRVMTNVFMELAAAGRQLHVMGKSRAKRQYIYSKDLAHILIEAAKREGNEVVNAGMDEAHTNLEIARMINEAFGSQVPVDYDDSSEETIEPSIMSTDYLHENYDYEVRSMEEALTDIYMEGIYDK